MAGSPKSTEQRFEGQKRADEALRLRIAGKKYREIAEILGYAHASGAANAVRNALLDIPKEAAKEVLELELERLDEILERCLEIAKNGDLEAIDRVIKIMDRRSKFLGLDKVKPLEGLDEAAKEARRVTVRFDYGEKKPDDGK